MRTRKDFIKMSPLDIFLSNGSHEFVDKNLQKRLESLENEIRTYFYKSLEKKDSRILKKWKKAQEEYSKVLKEKADNKEEWMILLKVAKERRINLQKQTLTLGQI